MQQQIAQPAPPQGVWEAIWPSIAPALVPELVGAMLITLVVTHAIKIEAVLLFPQVAHTVERWRAFCTAVSVLVGATAGTVAWLAFGATWVVIPLVAFGAGPIWRLIQALLPAMVAGALITSTDRKFRQEAQDEVS